MKQWIWRPILFLILLLTACSHSKPPFPHFELLKYVPQNSPYVFFSAQALPPGIRHLIGQKSKTLMTIIDPERSKSIGLDGSGRWLIYGDLKHLVLRLPLGDAEKFRAYWQSVLQKEGWSAQLFKDQSNDYQWVDLGSGGLLMAVLNDHILLSAARNRPDPADLNRLFHPAAHSADFSWAKTKFLGYASLKIDPKRMHFNCPAWQHLSTLYAGFTEPDQFEAELELSDVLKNELSRLVEPVFWDQHARLSLALGLNISQLKPAVQTLLKQLDSCPPFNAYPLQKISALIELFSQPSLLSIRGFSLNLNHWQKNPLKLDGYVLVRTPNPDQVFNLLSLLNYAYAQIRLPDQGLIAIPKLPNLNQALWAGKQNHTLILSSRAQSVQWQKDQPALLHFYRRFSKKESIEGRIGVHDHLNLFLSIKTDQKTLK